VKSRLPFLRVLGPLGAHSAFRIPHSELFRALRLAISAFCFLLSQFRLFSTPSRVLATETLTLARTLSGLVNQAYALTPAEIELMWQTAPPRMPLPPPGT
jgi:hypothetical protein